MNDSGWIKLHRSLLDWEWYSDINVSRLFVHLVIKANHLEKRWQGHTIKRGQLVTSYQNLAAETGLTVQAVRTAINKLKKTGELTSKSTNKFTLLTLVKYRVYQYSDTSSNRQNNKRRTNEQQTNNKRTTNEQQQLKNDKNIKNERMKEERGDFEILKTEIENLGSDFAEAWNRYKAYRKKLDRFKYHDEKSERSAISKLGKLANGQPETAIKIIEQTIDNGWKGFFNLKTQKNGKSGNSVEDILAACERFDGMDI